MSNGGALPPEILTDVLSRLPVKSLCRFKSVSPSWKSLISDPYFAKTHLNRTNNEDPNHLDRKIILISSSSHHLYSVDLARVNPVATPLDFPTLEQHAVDEWVKVWNSCDGLLLVSYNDNNSNFLLLNPSTRECKKLPALPFVPSPVCGFMVNFYGVGYDSSTDDYKVVILSYSSRFEETIVAVYSLKTDAWRRIQDLPYVLLASGSVVFFNGCLHCFCYRIDSYAMVAFDLSDEILREVPLPAPSIDYKITYYHLAVLGDCLCLVIKQRSSQVDVWLMKEYGIRDSWKKVTFDMPKTNTMKLSCFLAEDELLMKNEEWRLDRGCKEKLVVYNWKDETMRDVAVCGIPTEFTFGGTYVESILSPHHGGIWRQ